LYYDIIEDITATPHKRITPWKISVMFLHKTLPLGTLFPTEVSNDLPWEEYSYFVEPHITSLLNILFLTSVEMKFWLFSSSIQAHYSTGAVASSFTSTAQVPVTQQEAGMKSPALVLIVRYQNNPS